MRAWAISVLAITSVSACARDPVVSPTPTPTVVEPEPAKAPAPVAAKPTKVESPTEVERPALDIEYVPTPENVVAVMLEMAKVGKDDVLYDLGCGDGRLLVEAAKRYGTRGYGVDLDPDRIAEARANIEKAGVGHLVTVEQRNIFSVDLKPATVLTLYLLPELNVRLIPQLEKLRDGARVISHDFGMEGVEYDDVREVIAKHHRPPPELREHYVYRWTTPLKKNASP